MTLTSARTRVATVVAALILTVTAACAGGGGDSLVGTEWVADSGTGYQLVIAFTSETDCELISIEDGVREVADPNATYTLADDIVTVMGDGDTFEFALDGDTLTLTADGTPIVFEKN